MSLDYNYGWTLRDEIAKEVFLDVVHQLEPKDTSLPNLQKHAEGAMVIAEIFMVEREKHLAKLAAATSKKANIDDPATKGCSVCHGAGFVRPAGASRRKAAPACSNCKGKGKVAV